MNRLIFKLIVFSLVCMYAKASDTTKENPRTLKEFLESGAPLELRAVKPQQNLRVSAIQAAFEIYRKSFQKKLGSIERSSVNACVRQDRLANHILLFTDPQKIEMLKAKAHDLEVFNNVDKMALLTLYAVDSLIDTIRLEEDKDRFKYWLAYLEETSVSIKKNIEIIYNQIGTLEIKLPLLEGINEQYASQAAYEIQKKSFPDFYKPELPINQLRQRRLAEDILMFLDINKIKEGQTMSLNAGLERKNIFNYFDEVGLRTVYALDGLIGKIKLEENKDNFKDWLAYLENTSEKIKENLEIMYSQR